MYAAQFAQLSVLSVADVSAAAVGFAWPPPVEQAASASADAPAPAPASSVRRFSCSPARLRDQGTDHRVLGKGPSGHGELHSGRKRVLGVGRYCHTAGEDSHDHVRIVNFWEHRLRIQCSASAPGNGFSCQGGASPLVAALHRRRAPSTASQHRRGAGRAPATFPGGRGTRAGRRARRSSPLRA